MVSEARKHSMAWMETDYSKHTHFQWKIKWRLKHWGALRIMIETALEAYNFYNHVKINFIQFHFFLNFPKCNHPLLLLRRSTKRAELYKMSAENLSYWACTNSS